MVKTLTEPELLEKSGLLRDVTISAWLLTSLNQTRLKTWIREICESVAFFLFNSFERNFFRCLWYHKRISSYNLIGLNFERWVGKWGNKNQRKVQTCRQVQVLRISTEID